MRIKKALNELKDQGREDLVDELQKINSHYHIVDLDWPLYSAISLIETVQGKTELYKELTKIKEKYITRFGMSWEFATKETETVLYNGMESDLVSLKFMLQFFDKETGKEVFFDSLDEAERIIGKGFGYTCSIDKDFGYKLDKTKDNDAYEVELKPFSATIWNADAELFEKNTSFDIGFNVAVTFIKINFEKFNHSKNTPTKEGGVYEEYDFPVSEP